MGGSVWRVKSWFSQHGMKMCILRICILRNVLICDSYLTHALSTWLQGTSTPLELLSTWYVPVRWNFHFYENLYFDLNPVKGQWSPSLWSEYLEPVGSSCITTYPGSLEETCLAGKALMLPAPILLCKPRSAQSGAAEIHSEMFKGDFRIIQSNAFTLKVEKMKSRKEKEHGQYWTTYEQLD